jgi:hypothetical protein
VPEPEQLVQNGGTHADANVAHAHSIPHERERATRLLAIDPISFSPSFSGTYEYSDNNEPTSLNLSPSTTHEQ